MSQTGNNSPTTKDVILLGYINPGDCYPYALITVAQRPDGKIMIVWPDLTINTVNKPIEQIKEANNFIQLSNGEEYAEGSYAFALSETEYFYGPNEQMIKYLGERIRSGELPKDTEGWVSQFLATIQE